MVGPVLAVPLVVLFALDHAPDVLVSDTTQATAIRGATGLELAAGKAQSFGLGVWRETYADPIATPTAQNCDGAVCTGTSSAGFSWAIVRDPTGFAAQCGHADLVISRLVAPADCATSTLIDGADLDQHGVQWLRWNGVSHSFEVRAAVDHLDRPWRLKS